MRLSQQGVSLWCGTPDAPAPSGVIAAGADTSIMVGLQPHDAHASVTVLYRVNHGHPQMLPAQAVHAGSSGSQYFRAHLAGFKPGDKVEYVPIYRSGARQIPSNEDAEKHVASFTMGAPTAHPAAANQHPVLSRHHGPEAEDPKEALRTVLHAVGVLNSAALEDSFVKLYFSHDGHAESFWEEVAKHPEFKSRVEQLQFTLQVDLLASGHLPLIQALVKMPGVKSMQDLAQLDESVWHGLIAKTGAPNHIAGASPQVQAQLYLSSIIATLQAAFPTLTVRRISAKSQHANPLAVRFLENSPDFDIRSTRVDVYANEHTATAFNGIAETSRAEVLKEVKRLQRLYSVSTNGDVFRSLLETGLNSAHAIAIIPRAIFTARYAHAFGGATQAAELHNRAQFINARNLHLRLSVHDIVKTPPTRGLGHHTQTEMVRVYGGHVPNGGHFATPHPAAQHLNLKAGSLHEDLVKRFPNSEELFGSMSLCNCDECESAIGPTAYLVDLFDFLDTSKRNAHGATPLDVLIGNREKNIPGRRPDLAFLKLTCANTNTAMPYIDIVNEILEACVASRLKLEPSASHDTVDSTTAELDANPQYLNQQAYRILDKAVFPFSLPFNRPLLVSRAYLGQLGTSRHEIVEAFYKDRLSPEYRRTLAAEQLGLSAEEFAIITGEALRPGDSVPHRPISDYFGAETEPSHNGQASSGNWRADLANAAIFLQRTGISFSELRALLSTWFISPQQPTGAAKEMFGRIPVSQSALSELVGSNLAHPADAMLAIELAGITAADLLALSRDNFGKMGKMPVMDNTGGSCDPATMKLQHFDGTNLGDETLDRMHRFIRLYRKIGWSIPDLDRAIYALAATDITPELFVHFARIKRLQTDHRITNLQILLSFWAPMETRGPDSLYRGLFLNKATHRDGSDPAFEQAYPDSAVLTNAGEVIASHQPMLRSAFRITASDLALILEDCGLDPATAPLSLENVSALYRRAALAKMLKLKVKDFLTLKAVSGCDPFASPERTCEFQALAATMARSGLTAPQLDYVVRHIDGASGHGGLGPGNPTVLSLAAALRNGMAAIVRDNVVTDDPTGSVTAQKLPLLFESDVADGLMGIINGAVNYSASLTVLPGGFTVPASLAKKVAYDPVAQLLICKSPLTAADRTALLGVAGDPAYRTAVESLYQQPLELIKSSLGTFLDVAEAQQKLVTDHSSLGPDLNPVFVEPQATDSAKGQTTVIAAKFAYLLKALTPYLIATQSAALLKTTISKSLKITDLMAKQLIEIVLTSRLDNTRKAIYDLQSLQKSGLSAVYYSNADLTGTKTDGIASMIAFDGDKQALPSGTGSVSWTGMLAPTGSGDFVFSLRTNGTPTLWVDDETAPLALVQSADGGEWIAKHVSLKAAHLYHLRLEVAKLPAQKPVVSLSWQSSATRKTPIPESNLYPASILQAFRETYIVLHKASLVINALKLTEHELLFLEQKIEGAPSLNLNGLPVSRNKTTAASIDAQAPGQFSGLSRAVRLAAFRKSLSAPDTEVTDLFAASTIGDAEDVLLKLTGWDAGITHDLLGPDGFNLARNDFADERWPIRLKACVDLASRLGVSARHLFHWSTVSSDFDTLETMGHEIKKCVQAQYDADTWLTIAKPLSDKLRDAQRNALVAYLLPRMKLKDANQLFEYFLIDPAMGVCTETSRISLAHSSVQMFVQRCLMNLEDTGDIQTVRPEQIDGEQWEKWRKHFRFWQANYRVLMTPENWMQQSFRDDKTSFFTALESDLSQQEVSTENVETAYMNYLEKLQQVARLEIIGTFWQDVDPDTNEHINILHVFGRTFHSPHTYYYRKFVNFTTWTPWEEMQVTIEGDHVMPLIWNRRLYVFWPIFIKKSKPPATPSSVNPTKTIPVEGAQSFWQVSLAWTELKHNKWSGKQVSKNAFDMDPHYFVEDHPARYAKFAYSFKSSITRDSHGRPESLIFRCVFHGLTIEINRLGWFFIPMLKDTTEVVGAFEVGGCSGESVEAIFGTMPWPNPITPPETQVEALTYVQKRDHPGLTMTKAGTDQTATFLHGSPSMYRLLYPHQFSDYLLQAPLFYQDKHKTFFVCPHDDSGPVHQIATPNRTAFRRQGASGAVRAKAVAPHAGASLKHAASGGAAAHPPQHAAAHPSQPVSTHPPRHGDAAEISQVLAALEQRLVDIGSPYTRHATGQHSAWDSHALSHYAHPSNPTHLRFETFYHPFVCEFMKAVSRQGIASLLTGRNQTLASGKDDFAREYRPSNLVAQPLPVEQVDFENGPYAIYNQELFLHIPDLIAERLLQNQRYDDAIRWLKFIFDPTKSSDPKEPGGNEPPPARFWNYVPFKKSPRDNLQQLLELMESGNSQHSQLIADWAKNPFQPYAIARHRPDAYKKNIFMKYVRTHIAHGDALFQTDLKEAVNEAEQHYVIAAHLLGPPPEKIAPLKKPRPESYATLRNKLDAAGEMLLLLENEFPFSGKITSHPASDSGGMQNLGRTLYFCAPENDEFRKLWDTVEDRLYKIRNCLNFKGIFRQLALFDPPIDPGLLVRAAAQGIDLGSVMTDIQSPLPAYRFTYMLQKAVEMCNECRTFAGSFLSALEKSDAEVLAVMRSTHEVGILDLMHRVKLRQLDEASAQIDSLNASRNTAVQRYSFYQTLMGVTSAAVPAEGANIPLMSVPSQPSLDLGGIQLIPEEALELTLSTAASVIQMVAGSIQAVATPMHAIPTISVHAQPVGVGGSVAEGGAQLGPAVESGSKVLTVIGEILALGASLSGKMGTYFRRQADWALQNNLAACEIMQIDRQLAAAHIRVDISQAELDSHEKQMENAQKILDFTANQKFTNKDLYGWMVSDLSSSYFACYQLAFTLAKKAERAYRFERGLTDSNFIQFGYWDSLRKGLLAGDRLHLALKQLEVAYTDQNTRDQEISRDFSLLQNAPLALIALKETGVCEINVPESFFDADYPGHYMRRIKNVSLTLPCVVGPYTSVNCRLTLLANKTRVSSDASDQYAEDVENGDARFVNNFAAVQSIATSHGVNDSGMFEVNFRDERYLPFEGAGAISRWRLAIPKENNAWDLQTLSEPILHFKYMAWEGGESLRRAAREALASGPQEVSVRLFSLRHEFPTEWYRFLNPGGDTAGSGQSMTFNLSGTRFPYRYRGKTIAINGVDLYLNFKDLHDPQTFTRDGTPLGEYAGGKPLKLSLTPPGGTAVDVQLKSNRSLLNGLPHALADVSDQTAGLGAWKIEITSEALAALAPSLRSAVGSSKNHMLKSDVVADMLFVCRYAVS